MIKRVTLEDFPDLFDIAEACYPPFDRSSMWKWGVMALASPNVIAVRDEDAFGVAVVAPVEWDPHVKHGMQRYIAARNKATWQVVKVMRTLRDWCMQECGTVDYQFGELTGMRMDIIAKRLGARPNSPTYVCERA